MQQKHLIVLQRIFSKLIHHVIMKVSYKFVHSVHKGLQMFIKLHQEFSRKMKYWLLMLTSVPKTYGLLKLQFISRKSLSKPSKPIMISQLLLLDPLESQLYQIKFAITSLNPSQHPIF